MAAFWIAQLQGRLSGRARLLIVAILHAQCCIHFGQTLPALHLSPPCPAARQRAPVPHQCLQHHPWLAPVSAALGGSHGHAPAEEAPLAQELAGGGGALQTEGKGAGPGSCWRAGTGRTTCVIQPAPPLLVCFMLPQTCPPVRLLPLCDTTVPASTFDCSGLR